MNLTPKQLEVLELIQQYREQYGYAPTMQELADQLHVSKVTVFERVESLVRKGALLRQPNKARSLELADGVSLPNTSPMQVPLVGRIAAGNPIERCQDGDTLDMAAMLAPRPGQQGETFALLVEGDSMRDEGILDGDYVLIEQRSTARNGDRVVALLPDGETTLKTFFRDGSSIRLQPANPDFDPIIVDTCDVQGVVTGVLRRY
ncbi:MAG: transcriptional repressor LexA [Phycisphaerales bacterium]|jgi:repressor LexA|nr:transcriptional repressor LexA [Phycisphaerales bacterium]